MPHRLDELYSLPSSQEHDHSLYVCVGIMMKSQSIKTFAKKHAY